MANEANTEVLEVVGGQFQQHGVVDRVFRETPARIAVARDRGAMWQCPRSPPRRGQGRCHSPRKPPRRANTRARLVTVQALPSHVLHSRGNSLLTAREDWAILTAERISATVPTPYAGRSSPSAQARASALLGASVPGTVAQPLFSMISRRSQVEAFLNSVNFAGASACALNFSTQIGVSTSTTAASARCFAIRSAVPPSVHPKTEKPSTDMPAAPITAPRIPDLKLEGSFVDLMSCAPAAFPRSSLLVRRGNTCDNVCKKPAGGC